MSDSESDDAVWQINQNLFEVVNAELIKHSNRSLATPQNIAFFKQMIVCLGIEAGAIYEGGMLKFPTHWLDVENAHMTDDRTLMVNQVPITHTITFNLLVTNERL